MEIRHLRGWLLIFVMWEALLLTANVRACVALLDITGASPAELERVGALFLPALLAQAIAAAMAVCILIGVMRVVRRHARTRRYWIWLLSLSILSLACEWFLAIWMTVITANAQGVPVPSTDKAFATTVVRIAFAAAWLAYWVTSRRVREVFVAETSSAGGSRRVGNPT